MPMAVPSPSPCLGPCQCPCSWCVAMYPAPPLLMAMLAALFHFTLSPCVLAARALQQRGRDTRTCASPGGRDTSPREGATPHVRDAIPQHAPIIAPLALDATPLFFCGAFYPRSRSFGIAHESAFRVPVESPGFSECGTPRASFSYHQSLRPRHPRVQRERRRIHFSPICARVLVANQGRRRKDSGSARTTLSRLAPYVYYYMCISYDPGGERRALSLRHVLLPFTFLRQGTSLSPQRGGLCEAHRIC